MDRRTFIKTGLVATASAFTLRRSFLPALASHPVLTVGDGPYGAPGEPDANGVRLPPGFRSRIVARSPLPVEGTLYPWHVYPDGGATFAVPDDGGWIYVSNSEVLGGAGGAGAIRFAADGTIVDAYRILGGTNGNCAGGPTPWGTWLSCEEFNGGQVWECDPTGARAAQARPAMGVFTHEAAAVDPLLGHVYMTEDSGDGCFYRFEPTTIGDLGEGTLQVAVVDGNAVSWVAVPNPAPIPLVQTATKNQVEGAARFDGGEGCWFDVAQRTVYFATKGDNRIWEYDVDAARLRILHDRGMLPDSPLTGADNVTVAASGDLYVCEDSGNLEMILITPEGTISPFLRLSGHAGSELAGAAFDPSGTRLYFSSQRGERLGVTFEVSGPFRGAV